MRFIAPQQQKKRQRLGLRQGSTGELTTLHQVS